MVGTPQSLETHSNSNEFSPQLTETLPQHGVPDDPRFGYPGVNTNFAAPPINQFPSSEPEFQHSRSSQDFSTYQQPPVYTSTAVRGNTPIYVFRLFWVSLAQ